MLALERTGRPAKSTTSISEKLLRESIRLTQVQDIAGCRLIVSEMVDQDRVVESLKKLFDYSIVVDRREHPSHGYRAVHVIVKHNGKPVEIQVRTELQQVWAELSEKLSDVVDPGLKYGKGDDVTVKALLQASEIVADEEAKEASIASLEKRVSVMLAEANLAQDREEELMKLRSELSELHKKQMSIREKGVIGLRRILDHVPKRGEE